MKLKNIIPTVIACGAVLAGAASCGDMLDTTSNGYVFDEDHKLDSANDSLYSVIGILSQLQSLGERYVVLGEIRGDLVSVPATAPVDYQNASAFMPIEDKDAFGPKRDYYSVINNCNVALSRMDTSVTEHGTQVLMPEYAAIRAIRDWTFLQLGLNYGSAPFTEEPVLTVEAAGRKVPEMPLDQLVTRLIEDLQPYAKVEVPRYYGDIDRLPSIRFFIRPSLLLADLYLYNGNYEEAAALYYDEIDRNGYIMNVDKGYRWTDSHRSSGTGEFAKTYYDEAINCIPYSSDARLYHPDLVNMTYNPVPTMYPADWFVEAMNTFTHYHINDLNQTNISANLQGDLRGIAVDRNNQVSAQSFGTYSISVLENRTLISKYLTNGDEYPNVVNTVNPLFEGKGTVITRHVALCRIPHVYLRYAEAVNRAGKPSVAFAALKYGLRGEVLGDSTKVNPEEMADEAIWTNFKDEKYNNNYGSAMRGRGLGIALVAEDYVIPELETRNDSIDWVEERILEEMAAETAFEGNRFFDLMRVSHHRPGHPAYAASKIARRFDNEEAAKARLSNIEALWIK